MGQLQEVFNKLSHNIYYLSTELYELVSSISGNVTINNYSGHSRYPSVNKCIYICLHCNNKNTECKDKMGQIGILLPIIYIGQGMV